MFKEDDQILDEAMKFRTQKKLNQIFLDIYDPYYREVIDSERRLFKLEIIEKVKVVPRGLCSAMQTIILSLIEEWFTWPVWPPPRFAYSAEKANFQENFMLGKTMNKL